MVVVDHTNEFLEMLNDGAYQKVLKSFQFGGKRADAGCGDLVFG